MGRGRRHSESLFGRLGRTSTLVAGRTTPDVCVTAIAPVHMSFGLTPQLPNPCTRVSRALSVRFANQNLAISVAFANVHAASSFGVGLKS
jgi:hypothetical protein